jgi:hypothetical protein
MLMAKLPPAWLKASQLPARLYRLKVLLAGVFSGNQLGYSRIKPL